jgi:hypothetical protein
MPVALALMVICPLNDQTKPVSECMKCPHYAGQMYEGTGIMKTATMLNCIVIEDSVMRVDNED